MSGSIRNKTGLSAAILLILFVVINFAVSYRLITKAGSKYQASIASAALDFAEMSIDADKAKESYITRAPSDDYDSVRSKLAAYQDSNSDIIARISLVCFSNSAGSYIYDSAGEPLCAKLEYDSYTSSIKAELINGRNSIDHTENGRLTSFRPLRTVDDNLCGFLIVELQKPYESSHYKHLITVYSVLLGLSLLFTFVMLFYLNRRIFRPLRKITASTEYLSGDDSATAGMDASVIFDTKRNDEIGRLSSALQKVFFDMNSGAEHLSQAIYDANHDGMTQHLNKRCYHSMEENFRSCESICVIYFDVNNLKLMNDTLGHESGDYVIKRAADYIRQFLSEGYFCFRMGGDEFLLVMTECSLRNADRIMEKLDKDSPYILSKDKDSVKCSLSYGCAFAKGEYSYEALLSEAEENMYTKKAELKKRLQMPER